MYRAEEQPNPGSSEKAPGNPGNKPPGRDYLLNKDEDCQAGDPEQIHDATYEEQ